MQGIEITLHRNKQYNAVNDEDYKVIAGENNATTVTVHFPTEYTTYSKRVDFKNIRNEKWTIGLYTPEDPSQTYDDDFDTLNFAFTIPSAVTVNGEILMQFIAYLPDGTKTFVPFEIVKIEVNESVMYVKKKGSDNPDLIVSAFETANLALATAEEANNRSQHAEELAEEAAGSAESAAASATAAQQSATSAQNSASAAQQSATSAQNSASAAQTSSSQSAASASAAQSSASEAAESASESAESASEAIETAESAVETAEDADSKATKSLEIVDALSVTDEEIDCEAHVEITIQTDSGTKHKNIHFKIPKPKTGTSYRSKGAWNSTTQYINNQYYVDTVSCHGCTYYCKQTHTNHEPVDSDESQYWGLMAIKGSDGGVTIVDNLNSDRADFVLSAKQGKVLKELIASEIADVVSGTTVAGKTKKWETSRAITVTVASGSNKSGGTIKGSGTSYFDGSANGEISLNLSDSGIGPGTYSSIQVNSKGIAIKGGQIIEVGSTGQTSPSSDLAIGGIFFKEI